MRRGARGSIARPALVFLAGLGLLWTWCRGQINGVKRYRIIKIKRGEYRISEVDPEGDSTVPGGFRRKIDAMMWIVEQTIKWGEDAEMDTYTVIPVADGTFLVQVVSENGGTIAHRFDTEAQALAWIVDRRTPNEIDACRGTAQNHL